MSDYYTSVTAAGTAAFANALTTNTPVNFTGITLTDGTTDQKTVSIQSITTDTNNPSWKVVKAFGKLWPAPGCQSLSNLPTIW